MAETNRALPALDTASVAPATAARALQELIRALARQAAREAWAQRDEGGEP
ncbi:MAG TPA: hypothetical protein VGN96_11100 [Roseococcus sp.]|nr:hypothetical protein [Roseococcus sp.]